MVPPNSHMPMSIATQVFFNTAGSAIPIGSFSLGLFYGCYTICAVFFAPLITSMLAIKWSVVVGLVFYCYYLASLPLAGGVYYWTESVAGVDFVLFTGAGGVCVCVHFRVHVRCVWHV